MYRLTVRTLITVEANEAGFLYQPRDDEAPAVEPELRDAYERVQRVLARRLAADQEGAELVSLRLEEEGGRLQAKAAVRTPAVITPAQVASIEADLRRFIDPSIRLTISSAVEADATAGGYVVGSEG